VQVKENGTDKPAPGAAGAPQKPTVVGKGWTTVLVAKVPNANAPTGNAQAGGGGKSFSLDSLPKVSGAWGSGHLLTGRLFSVLLTDDGRVLAGAVGPEQLYAAAR
jgi:hypothetical protein